MATRIDTRQPGMRREDWFHFHSAAAIYHRWILVRWTNPDSLKYIGVRTVKYAYAPKPLDCKAKTAKQDVGGKRLKGLVCDPTAHPGCMSADDAREWGKFLRSQGASNTEELNRANLTGRTTPLVKQMGSGTIRHVDETRRAVDRSLLEKLVRQMPDMSHERVYLVDRDEGSDHYGCLTLNGRYIHGDYDLKDIIDPANPGLNVAVKGEMFGQPHMRGPDLERIATFVNQRIGVPMVQHGAEAQFKDHVQDTIEVFGPSAEAHTLVGEKEIRRFYIYGFTRGAIDMKVTGMGDYVAPASRVYVSTGHPLIGVDPRL